MSELNFGAYLQRSGNIVPAQYALRAQIQWSRILDKQTDIELRRGDVFLLPQTVRIEFSSSISDEKGSFTDATERKVTVFGVRGHPDIDDLDIQVWDSFIMESGEFTVVSVNRELIGQIQAHCEVVGV